MTLKILSIYKFYTLLPKARATTTLTTTTITMQRYSKNKRYNNNNNTYTKKNPKSFDSNDK